MAERASLSPSRFPSSAFRDFKKKNARAEFESDVMKNIIPVLCGDANIPNQQNILFTELDAITNNNAVKPKPDFFDGALLQELSRSIRDDPDLRRLIIPTKHRGVPVAPNFFLEIKGPDGNTAAAQRKACYDGAYGARAMHALQNHGRTYPVYDGNAYTFSSTYHASTGALQLYAHHVTAPTTEGGRPEYHMTQLRSFGITDTCETFVEGAAAFRNARLLAKRHRDAFIEAANAMASSAEPAAAAASEDAMGTHGDAER
ncbi:hypothetical protein LCI18_007266 [Fusarium solani-melongenae]|uniref:Uncharacterized protein n=1 Tax=Fusarium solani subsp. cucurbitae TaxID=2747967 RepID=A0ACD3Z589_FUSSC|nr:hypothetical protein LCI18_007266 [Fusarium solani-melongenae]